jgi:hypothetical protein
MILPYVATALLVLATVYSAIVIFRQNPGSAVPTWLFPQGANTTARVVAGMTTLALVIGIVAWATMSARISTRRSLRFLVPESYTGWVRVEFDIPDASPLPLEDGQTLLKIPPSGVLKTSSPEQYGWAKDDYLYYSAAGLRPLPDSGPGRLIWGKINGEASGSSGKRKYEEFFVGTEKQYKEQVLGEQGKAAFK